MINLWRAVHHASLGYEYHSARFLVFGVPARLADQAKA
jgi:hypothetical protein